MFHVLSCETLKKQGVYFRDKGKKKNTSAIQRFSLFQGFFVSLLLYIMQYFVVKNR